MRKVKHMGCCCALLAVALACVTAGCAVCAFLQQMAAMCWHVARAEWNTVRYGE